MIYAAYVFGTLCAAVGVVCIGLWLLYQEWRNGNG